MPSCCCSPLGGGSGPSPPASLTNLPNTVWVAQGTTVAPGDQTGNIELPFETIADGLAALAAIGNDQPKVLVVMPGDYSAEAAQSWNASTPTTGVLHIVNGAWQPMQLAQSIQNVALPDFTFDGIVNCTGVIFANVAAGFSATLELTACQQLGGTFAADTVNATNCYLNQTLALSGSSQVFRDCSTGPITLAANEAAITFIDCNVAGDVTWSGDPGVALMDWQSIFYMFNNGHTLTGGRLQTTTRTTWMVINVEEPNNPFFDTSASAGTFVPLTALITDFAVSGASGFTLGADGVLTWSGPTATFMVRADFCLGNPDNTNIAIPQFGVSKNFDLDGLTIGALAALQAGAAYDKLVNDTQQPMGVQRRVQLASGDTLSLSCASNFVGTSSDIQIFAGSMSIEMTD